MKPSTIPVPYQVVFVLKRQEKIFWQEAFVRRTQTLKGASCMWMRRRGAADEATGGERVLL